MLCLYRVLLRYSGTVWQNTFTLFIRLTTYWDFLLYIYHLMTENILTVWLKYCKYLSWFTLDPSSALPSSVALYILLLKTMSNFLFLSDHYFATYHILFLSFTGWWLCFVHRQSLRHTSECSLLGTTPTVAFILCHFFHPSNVILFQKTNSVKKEIHWRPLSS